MLCPRSAYKERAAPPIEYDFKHLKYSPDLTAMACLAIAAHLCLVLWNSVLKMEALPYRLNLCL